jgi:hypothetical protein
MKRILMIITLLTSASSFALTCTSDENSVKKITLTDLHYNLVQGSESERVVGKVFAGKKTGGYFITNYELFDQNGEFAEFTVNTNPPDIGSHCRARVCPSQIPQNKLKMGKLIIEGKQDEYFTCI